MDLADHFRTIAANWWRILLIAAVVGVGVFVYSYNQADTFEGFTLINVTPNELRNQGNVSAETLTFKVASFAQIAKTPFVAERAAKKLEKYGTTAAEARASLSVVPNGVAGLLGIKAAAHSRQEALDRSHALAEALVDTSLDDAQRIVADTASALDTQLKVARTVLANASDTATRAQAQQAITTLQLQQAANVVDPTKGVTIVADSTLTNDGLPVAPTPARDGLLAFLVAFVVTAEGFVIARAVSDRFARASDVDAITELTGLPVLAMVPRGRGPAVLEAFRTLRTNLMFLEGSGRPRTLAVVSPNPGAGKSFTCTNLGESAVAVDAQVVLIDADLRRPVLHERLRTPREPGLSDALRGGPIVSSLHKVDGLPGMRLIPCGSPVGDTAAALGGRNFRHVLEGLDTSDLVVVDTPPGAGYADALAVAAQCDATILVLDAQSTRRQQTKQFVEALERTGASLIGVVLNGATLNRRDTYYGYDRG